MIAGFGLLLYQRRQNNESTRWWFWPFVLIAFVAWSLGASADFRDLFDISADTGQWLLGLVALLLPAMDLGLGAWFKD